MRAARRLGGPPSARVSALVRRECLVSEPRSIGNRDLSPTDWERLLEVLSESRRLGFLGPGALEAQVTRSLAFLHLCPPSAALSLDLGSGGGLPGLVLAIARPRGSWVLLDGNQRRTAFLTDTVIDLGLADRITVLCQRAEDAGRSALRGTVDVIVARGFAAPAPTAECASPLLRTGGSLIVAEPPGAPSRWPAEGLGRLGLEADGALVQPVALRRFRQLRPCADRYPRRTGIPAKRPLFRSDAE